MPEEILARWAVRVDKVPQQRQRQALRKEASDLRQALEDRKLIEKAKGVLMKRAGLDEADAFRRLQKLASDRNRKLVDIAQMILTAEEAYGSSARSGTVPARQPGPPPPPAGRAGPLRR